MLAAAVAFAASMHADVCSMSHCGVCALKSSIHMKQSLPLQPLLSKVELERTKALAAEFGRPGGVGEELQKLLEKRAEEKDNWVNVPSVTVTQSLSC